jgi:hypothetical protein
MQDRIAISDDVMTLWKGQRMAFNPVKRVRQRRFPTVVQAQFAERLNALASLPPMTSTPYLTVSLDWRPSGSDPEYRGALQRFEQEATQIQKEYWPRGDVYDSLDADIQRIRDWLRDDVDPAARGIFIVANSGAEVFEAISLGIPLQTKVLAGPVPALMAAARLDEDNPTYGVLLADQQNAYLSIISQAHVIEELAMASSDYPRKQATGGWSQRRFQQRADERIMALGRDISEEASKYLADRGIEMLIVAGDETITGVLDRTMPNDVKELVIGTIRLDIEATQEEVLEATMPIAERAEAERELISVQTLSDMAGAGGTAVTGSADVLDMLVQGRVSYLVMNEDFHEDGWADFANHRYGAGERREILSGSVDEIAVVPVIVEEEMVRLAIQHSAEIDIIHTGVPLVDDDPNRQLPDAGEIPRSSAASKLDELSGVGAILRY